MGGWRFAYFDKICTRKFSLHKIIKYDVLWVFPAESYQHFPQTYPQKKPFRPLQIKDKQGAMPNFGISRPNVTKGDLVYRTPLEFYFCREDAGLVFAKVCVRAKHISPQDIVLGEGPVNVCFLPFQTFRQVAES